MKFVYILSRQHVEKFKSARCGEMPSDFFRGAVELANRGEDVTLLPQPGGARGMAGAATRLFDRVTAHWRPSELKFEQVADSFATVRLARGADLVVTTKRQVFLGLAAANRIARSGLPLAGMVEGIVRPEFDRPGMAAQKHLLAWTLQGTIVSPSGQGEVRGYIEHLKVPPQRVRGLILFVDLKFWTPGEGGEDFVLSVGNDTNRDFTTLLRAAPLIRRKIIIVTKLKLPEPLPPNVEVISGAWYRDTLPYSDLRSLYRRAACVATPLVPENVRSSGASVTLQAMACGTPNVVSITPGFWDPGRLRDGEHFIGVQPGDPSALASAVDRACAAETRDNLIEAGFEYVRQNGGIDNLLVELEGFVREFACAGRGRTKSGVARGG